MWGVAKIERRARSTLRSTAPPYPITEHTLAPHSLNRTSATRDKSLSAKASIALIHSLTQRTSTEAVENT